jgi:hypothetical protein
MEEDFDYLIQGQKGGRETRDGKLKGKKPKTQFPLRTMSINTEFLKNNEEFFVDYDFTLMLFIITAMTFAISMIGKVFLPEMFQTNLVFYMALFCLMLMTQYLLKNAFTGPNKRWSCTDESKVEVLMAVKAFGLVYVGLYYLGSSDIFDFNIQAGHEASMQRINSIFNLYNNKIVIPVELTYVVMSCLASLISFTLVKQSVNFAYFLFNLKKQVQLEDETSKSDVPAIKKTASWMIKIAQFNFISPLLVCMLYVKPLSKELLVPDVTSEFGF